MLSLALGAALHLPSAAASQGPGCATLDNYLHWIGGRYPGVPHDVQAAGDILYVASSSSSLRGLAIFDISVPLYPALLSLSGFPLNARRLDLAGTVVFLAAEDTGLYVFDANDPSAPVALDALQTPGRYLDVEVETGYAYIADGFLGLRVVDVSDPSAIVDVASIPVNGEVVGLDVAGGRVCAVGSGTLWVIDPFNPQPVRGVWIGGGDPRQVALRGSLAFVADAGQSDGLRIIDISNPQAPALLGSAAVELPDEVVDVDVHADIASLVGKRNVYLFDVGNVAAPVLVGASSLPQPAFGVDQDAGRTYVARYAGLEIFDSTVPQWPILGRTPPLAEIGGASDVIVASGRAYVVGNEFWIVDVTDPSFPSLLGSDANGGNGIALAGNLAYVAAGPAFNVFDVSNPATPSRLSSLPGFDLASDVVLMGNRAYVADYYSLRVVDISDPSAPSMVAQIPVEVERLALWGSRLLGTVLSSVVVFDCTNPDVPSLIGEIETGYFNLGIAVNGLLAYVATGNNYSTLLVLDVADPTTPTILGTAGTYHTGHDVAVDGNLVYVYTDIGVQIFDVSDPSVPRLVVVASIPVDAAQLAEGWLFCAAGAGFFCAPRQCDPTTDVMPISRESLPPMFSLWPNPAHIDEPVHLALRLDVAARVELFDVAGRRVRELGELRPGSGPRLLQWTAPGSRPLPSGVYVVRASWPGGHAQQKLTWLSR